MVSFISEPCLTEIEGEYLVKFNPATYYMRERQEYFFNFDEAEMIDLLLINDIPCNPIPLGKNIFRVCIENNLGLSCLQPMQAGKPAGPPIWVEVYSYKFPIPEEHYQFYQVIVDDLFRQSANLPFTFEEITQRGVAESPQPPSPLFTYYFLKTKQKLFEAAIETILAEPHRALCDHPDQVLLHEVSEVDGDVLISILQSPDTWVEAGDFYLSRILQVDGRRYAPGHVWQRLPEETFDTPENRFVLHFLQEVLITADLLPSQPWWNRLKDREEVKAIQQLTSLLRQTIAHPMFAEVSRLSQIPFNSQVLMRREGYRDLFGLWQQFHSSSRPLFDRWEQAMDTRSMHHLYELWVYFKLINAIGDCQKLAITTADDEGILYGAKAVFHNGEELIYNQTFHPTYTRSFYSYSMVLRPDYIWIDRNNHRQVVLDAKFSVSITEKELESLNLDEPPAIHQEGQYNREDMYKMHTYKDALTGTQSAVIIYPGTIKVFMPEHAQRLYDLSLEEILRGTCERPTAQGNMQTIQLNGIGAIPLRPTSPND